MILNVSHLTKTFSGNAIITDASFFLNEKDKAAVVGLNGAGKTTLFNLIAGELTADSGDVSIKKGCTMGYLHQNNNLDSDLTILEELTQVIQPLLDLEARMRDLQEQMKHRQGAELEALYDAYSHMEQTYEQQDGYSARSRVKGVLTGLGFSECMFHQPLHTLSGGQKTRVFLGKLLLEQPDLILLDEPTNHLYLASIEWLETYLINYPGAVLIVSHDRYFLDRIVNRVIDVEQGTVTSYLGNYTAFTEKKAALREARQKAWLNQQQELKHEEAVIAELRSFNREKSIKRARSREKMLEKMERVLRPAEQKADMALHFHMTESSGNDVLEVNGISKSFGSNTLFRGLCFRLKRGEHVAIIGDNGSGKTTILKILTGMLSPDEGSVTLGARVTLAYYDQEHQVLHPEKTLFEELQDSRQDMSNTEIRNLLAAFLFTGEDVFRRISQLSGGEKGRISLAKLMLSRANFLILDEPTNHLDMVSKEVLEQAIRTFPGTVLYVSHDRYFINRTATRILNLTRGALFNYIGNYDYYLEKREDVEQAHMAVPDPAPGNKPPCEAGEKTVPSGGRAGWESDKAQKALRKKREASLQACEAEIHALEQELATIESSFSDPGLQRDAAALLELQKQKERAEAALTKHYETWEVLAEDVQKGGEA